MIKQSQGKYTFIIKTMIANKFLIFCTHKLLQIKYNHKIQTKRLPLARIINKL